jgi:tetratricopeptide (TPR) repeat protein
MPRQNVGERSRTGPRWLPYVDLGCAAAAGATWYIFPQAGPGPLALALLPWLVRLALTGRLSVRTPFDLPLLLFLLSAGLGVWTAYDREAAWAKFWLVVGSVLIFYALANATALGMVRAWLLALVGIGLTIYCLATHDWNASVTKIETLAHLGQAVQRLLPPLPGRALHPNVVGGAIAVTLPFAGLVAVQSWPGFWHIPRPRPLGTWLTWGVGLGLFLLTLFGLVMTVSRGAWLAVGLALLVLALWIASRRLSRGAPGRQAWLFPGLLVLALLVALGTTVVWPGSMITVLEALPGPNTWIGRIELLRNSLTLARDYLLTGAGLDTFPMLYSSYALLLHCPVQTHSHNFFLNVIIEQGMPALLILIWTWLLFAREAWHQTSRPDLYRDSTMLAAALALLIVLVHGLMDNALYSSGGLLFLFVPLAFAVPVQRQRSTRARRWLTVALPVGITLLLAPALLWREPILSSIYANLGAVHQSQAELSAYTRSRWAIQDAVRRELDLSRPQAEFERALALDPRNATANRRLGMIALSLGEYGKALDYLQAAHAVEPWSTTTRQLYGEALIVNGHVNEGQALWATVSDANGQLRSRASWYKQIGDVERATWIRQAAGLE